MKVGGSSGSPHRSSHRNIRSRRMRTRRRMIRRRMRVRSIRSSNIRMGVRISSVTRSHSKIRSR